MTPTLKFTLQITAVIFKEINVVDAQQTAQARNDLKEIIKLSEQLKKGSEELDNDPRAKVQRP